MDENEENRSDRATEPDLPPAPQVPEEELPPPPQAPKEKDLSEGADLPRALPEPRTEVQSEDLSSAPEVESEELSAPPEAPEEDLPSAPEVPREELSPAPEASEEDLSPAPEPQARDLSSGPEVPDKEVSPPPEAPEAQTSKERTSDARTEGLEEPQGSEGERRSAASETRRRGIMVATAIAVLALLLLGRRIRSSRRR